MQYTRQVLTQQMLSVQSRSTDTDKRPSGYSNWFNTIVGFLFRCPGVSLPRTLLNSCVTGVLFIRSAGRFKGGEVGGPTARPETEA